MFVRRPDNAVVCRVTGKIMIAHAIIFKDKTSRVGGVGSIMTVKRQALPCIVLKSLLRTVDQKQPVHGLNRAEKPFSVRHIYGLLSN